MKRKLLFGLLVVLLVVLPLFPACAEKKLTEVVELSFATFMPPFAAQFIAYQEWADKVAAQTDNMVTVTLYPMGSLLPPDDMIPGVKSGMAEIGDTTLGMWTDQFPLSGILMLPFMPVGETEEALAIWLTLQDEYKEMEAEFEDFKVLFYSGSGADAFALHSTDKSIVAPGDMAGVTVQAEGGMVEVMESINAALCLHLRCHFTLMALSCLPVPQAYFRCSVWRQIKASLPQV